MSGARRKYFEDVSAGLSFCVRMPACRLCQAGNWFRTVYTDCIQITLIFSYSTENMSALHAALSMLYFSSIGGFPVYCIPNTILCVPRLLQIV